MEKIETRVALRVKHKDKTFKINVGDVMMIKGEEKNRGHWKIGIVKPSAYWQGQHHSSCPIAYWKVN